MQLKKLSIKNYRLFNECEINFRKLTLLTGANSSGKSTILTLLNAIRQSKSPIPFPFDLVLRGDYTDLGSFADVINRNHKDESISISLAVNHLKNNYELSGEFMLGSKNKIVSSSNFFKEDDESLQVKKLSRNYKAQIVMPAFSKFMQAEQMKNLVNALKSFEIKQTKGSSSFENLFGAPKDGWVSFNIQRDKTVIEMIKEFPGGNQILYKLDSFLNQFSSRVSYVSPIRSVPERNYIGFQNQRNLDQNGRNAIQFVHQWRQEDKDKYRLFLRLMSQLELASSIIPVSNSRDNILKFKIKPYLHKEYSNITDVGFGISQIIPIVVADVLARNSDTLLLNQPEVHIHPSSQARLGDYFVSRLEKRNYIVETHSEYIINRLRLLAVQGKLNPADVVIVYFEILSNSPFPKVHHITLNDKGTLVNAPESFFSTYYVDAYNIATRSKSTKLPK